MWFIVTRIMTGIQRGGETDIVTAALTASERYVHHHAGQSRQNRIEWLDHVSRVLLWTVTGYR
jgi:hypothetical protein